MDYVLSADFIIISVKTLPLMTECAISVIYWHVLSTGERSVSLLSMHFEDTRYERWLFFLFWDVAKRNKYTFERLVMSEYEVSRGYAKVFQNMNYVHWPAVKTCFDCYKFRSKIPNVWPLKWKLLSNTFMCFVYWRCTRWF